MSRLLLTLLALCLLGAFPGLAAEEMALPPRPEQAGLDLVKALEMRQTTRQYKPGRLTPEDLSAILWAANGINRPASGKRTAPSAHGRQYLDIYLVGEDGAYLYDAPGHKLVLVTREDLKGSLGTQAHVAASSHVLVLVADLERMGGADDREYRLKNAAATAGCVGQNVYLMAAARGIGTCFVAGLRAPEIIRGLGLKPRQEPLYIMPLGYRP